MSTSVFDLFAKIKLDSSEYDKGLDDAEKKGEGVGSKIAGGLATAGKAAAVALGAAATGVAALTKQSVSAFAEQQQLVGGIETLFGAGGKSLEEYAASVGKTAEQAEKEYNKLLGAQEFMLDNAAKAFSTAGMSANEYMDTVTSFAASLVSSLGGDTKKAAEYADMALVDMSDNANKMGTSMESIQNAYQGFAKQNYNMLDNLKLGYGGTQKEMYRLMTDAAKLDKKFAETAQFSLDEKGHLEAGYADIVQAIHIVQDQMGISGTTIDEAGRTISGSAGQVKAAWENLVAGFASPDADLGQLIDNVVVSAETAFKNMMPAIEQALSGIGSFIEQMVPVITEKLPELVEQTLPPLISAATSLVTGLVTALPELIVVVAEQIPTIMQSVWDAIVATLPTLVESITTNAPMFIDAGMQILTMLGEGVTQGFTFLTEQLPTMIDEWLTGFDTKAPSLIDKGANMLTKLADGLTQGIPKALGAIAKVITDILSHLTNNMPQLMSKGTDLISNLATGLFNALPKVITSIGKIVSGILDFVIDNFPTIMQNGMKLIINLAQGLIKALPNIIQSITQIITGLINKLIAAIPTIIQTGFELIAQLALGLLKALPDIIKAALALVKGVIDTFTQTDWLSIGVNIIKGIISGVGSMAKAFLDAIVNLAKSAFNAIVDFFDIKSPSRLMRDKIGKNIVKGLIEGVNAEKKNAKKNAEQLGTLYVSAAKSRFKALKAENKLTLEEQWAFWLEVREQTKKGTKAYDEATVQIRKVIDEIEKAEDNYLKKRKEKLAYKKEIDGMTLAEEIAFWEKTRENLTKGSDAYKEATMEISSAKKELNTQLEALGNEYLEGVQKVSDELDKAVQSLMDAYEKAVEDRRKAIMGQFGLFDAVSLKDAAGADTLINNLQGQVSTMADWSNTLSSLETKIKPLSAGLYEELQGMGIDQLETLKTINNMSEEELASFIGLYETKNLIAQERSKKEHEELKKQTDEQIEELKKNAETQLQELETKYKDGIKALGKKGYKEFKKAGKYSVEGMGVGMNTQFDVLESQMKARAEALVASIQSALQIHSPSKVFADKVGKWIPLGIAEGFEQAMPEAQSGIMQSIEDMKGSISSALNMGTIQGSFVGTDNSSQSRGANFIQNLTINSPQALLPSEIARQTRLANQQMVLALRGV